jgi:hypothetical protein
MGHYTDDGRSKYSDGGWTPLNPPQNAKSSAQSRTNESQSGRSEPRSEQTAQSEGTPARQFRSQSPTLDSSSLQGRAADWNSTHEQLNRDFSARGREKSVRKTTAPGGTVSTHSGVDNNDWVRPQASGKGLRDSEVSDSSLVHLAAGNGSSRSAVNGHDSASVAEGRIAAVMSGRALVNDDKRQSRPKKRGGASGAGKETGVIRRPATRKKLKPTGRESNSPHGINLSHRQYGIAASTASR